MAKASRSSRTTRKTSQAGRARAKDRPAGNPRPAPKKRQASRQSPPHNSSSEESRAARNARRASRKETAPTDDLSTEEKIMKAAKKLFTKKGFAATRTRDIAQEADINLALLNYYFRSKEKLFNIVMLDNFRQFIKGISVNLLDETTTVDEKVRRIVTAYIDFLNNNPDLPIFIINEIRGNPSRIALQLNEEIAPFRQHLLRQLQEAARDGKIPPVDPFHFLANLIGLTVFPFIGRPILQRVTGIDDQQFRDFMEERKQLVPLWISAIMHAKYPEGLLPKKIK